MGRRLQLLHSLGHGIHLEFTEHFKFPALKINQHLCLRITPVSVLVGRNVSEDYFWLSQPRKNLGLSKAVGS